MSAEPLSTWPPSWPPEVPPSRPPFQPATPAQPSPNPPPILPSWVEVTEGHDTVAERLLDQRVILTGGHLDDALANRTAAQLLLLSRSDTRPIELHLACPTSDLDAALALADALDLVSAPVHAVVRGSLGGPVVAVLCAAEERAAHRNAVLVLSLPRTGGQGTAAQLAVQAEQHERQVVRLVERLAAVSGRDADAIAADLETGRMLSAEDALSYGLLNRLL